MTSPRPSASWGAFLIFYIIMLIVIGVLDWVNELLAWRYTGVQVGLMSMGVIIFAVIGWRAPDLKAEQGVLLAFTVGVLTIIPAILMSLGRAVDLWPQYFLIAFGMAAGSFLGFLFVRVAGRFTSKDE